MKLPLRLMDFVHDIGESKILYAEKKLLKHLDENEEKISFSYNISDIKFFQLKELLKKIFPHLKTVNSPLKNWQRYCGLISILTEKNLFYLYIIDINLQNKIMEIKLDDMKKKIPFTSKEIIIKILEEINKYILMYNK